MMKKIAWEEQDVKNYKGIETNECSICLEVLTFNKYVAQCGHWFHPYCIKNWLKENETCPVISLCTLLPL